MRSSLNTECMIVIFLSEAILQSVWCQKKKKKVRWIMVARFKKIYQDVSN